MMHAILVTLSVGDPFWVIDRDLHSFNVKVGAGNSLEAYTERPQFYGPANDSLAVWVNPRHVVCAVLFPALPTQSEL